jgi:hypothetical protein
MEEVHVSGIPDKQIKRQIDKNGLANAVQLGKNKSIFEFALGHHISCIDKLMKNLFVEGIGEIPIPVSTQV